MTALPGEGGITAAGRWRGDGGRPRLGAGAAARRGPAREARRERRSTDLSRLIRSLTSAIDAVHADLPFAAGYMRGSPQREFAFFTESFIDELAHAAGMEPLAFRMSMLGRKRAACALPAGARRGSRNGTAAAAEARWGSPAAPPSARTSGWSQAQASAPTRGSRSTGSSRRSIAGASSTAASSPSRSKPG